MTSVPFLDLKPQYKALEGAINQRIQTVLNHGQFILGPEMIECERDLAAYIGTKHCLAVSSGTDASIIALMALGVGPGDEVITTPFSFFATAEVISLVGATPVFVDIEDTAYNLDASKIEAAITPRTKVIMPVSLYGQPADYDEINALASRHGLVVIEDAAQSFGAPYKGKKSCALTRVGTTSFFPAKPLGCYGDGGAIFTNDTELHKKMEMIRVHGQASRYNHVMMGVNGRLDTLQCAILIEKLKRFDWEIAQRERIARAYAEGFGSLSGVVVPRMRADRGSVWAQYTVLVDDRDKFAADLKAKGVPTSIHYPSLLPHQPVYREMGMKGSWPVAERVSARCISLPMWPDMSDEQIAHVVKSVRGSGSGMIPVILSGGSGSRLWPVSRSSYPKQFCELLDESLFNKTVKRLAPLGSPWVVTVREMKTLTERSFKELGVPSSQAVYEPFGKNTAPAVALLCKRFQLNRQDQEIVGIFPADHLIDDESAFQAVVKAGEKAAAAGAVVTLGIKPTYPATGYGYIATEGAGAGPLKATGFREKPNEETAREFLARGGFYWNAGMFIFRISDMIALFQKLAPDVWSIIDTLDASLSNLDDVYSRVRSISFDYAIMEKLPSHVCIPCSFGWSDLGSWDSISEVVETSKNSVSVDSGENFVIPYGEKTYGFVGVEDLVVVDTSDALLIAKRGETELVKQLVEKLKADGNARVVEHPFEIRPWGRFEILADTAAYKAKVIEVDPGAQISYQSHQKRSEDWIFIAGQGELTLDGVVTAVGVGQQAHITAGVKHRIRNSGRAPLKFIEVQTGTYFGEDDIVRYQDDYQRVPTSAR